MSTKIDRRLLLANLLRPGLQILLKGLDLSRKDLSFVCGDREQRKREEG